MAFIGAGLSAFLGYPAWDELLQRLTGKAALSEHETAKCTRFELADKCRESLGDDGYYAFLRKCFPWNAPKPFGKRDYLDHHSDLLQIRFAAFATTNYDACLDHASNANVSKDLLTAYPVWRLRDLNPALLDDGRRRVFHLHGRLYNQHQEEVQDGVILTAQDYEEAYGRGQQYDGPVTEFLRRVLTSRTVVFFGCSFEDRQVERHLSAVRRQVEAEGRDDRHFAVVPVVDPQRPDPELKPPQYWDDELRPLGILPLRYRAAKDDNTHAALGSFLRKLADEARYQVSPAQYALAGQGAP